MWLLYWLRYLTYFLRLAVQLYFKLLLALICLHNFSLELNDVFQSQAPRTRAAGSFRLLGNEICLEIILLDILKELIYDADQA